MPFTGMDLPFRPAGDEQPAALLEDVTKRIGATFDGAADSPGHGRRSRPARQRTQYPGQPAALHRTRQDHAAREPAAAAGTPDTTLPQTAAQARRPPTLPPPVVATEWRLPVHAWYITRYAAHRRGEVPPQRGSG